MRLSVVIATKGRPEVLRETLASVAAADPAPAELIVVDGDPERSAEPVARDHDAVYLNSEPGLTRQRNRGVERATGEVIVFLDDDVEVEPGLFRALARAYEDPAVLGATGRVMEGDQRRFGNQRSLLRRLLVPGREGTMTRFGYPRRLQDPQGEIDVEFMPGCLMSGRAEAVREVGFDEELPGYGLAEDEDFSYRLSRRGRLRYLPDAALEHKTTGFRTATSRNFNRMLVVNRTYLFRKNFRRTPLSRMQFAGLIALLAGHRLVNRDWQGLRGLADGAREAWRTR